LIAFSTIGCQDQAGNLGREQFLGHIDTQLQTLGKAHLLNVEIFLQEFHLFAQRHLLFARVLDHPAQKVAESGDHIDGVIISLLAHQSGDGIQRIEQKVRLDLTP